MTDPPDSGETAPSRPSDSSGPLPVGRVAVVLIVFILVTAALVGEVHSTRSTATAVGGSTAAASPSSTRAAPTTTTTSTTIPPGNVAVLSANGSNVSQAATTLANQLHAQGWDTLPPVNATSNVSNSIVYYANGFQGPASTIAGLLSLPPTAVQPITTSVPVSSAAGADVVVVLGPDAAGKTIATAAPAK